MIRKQIAMLGIAMLASVLATASQAGTMLAIELGHGEGDFLNPEAGTGKATLDTGDYPSRLDLEAELWWPMTEDWSLAVSGGIGTFREKDEAGVPGDPDITFSSRSFKVRLGMDRMGKVGDRLTLFLGPGLEYWNGRTKFENVYGTTPPLDEVESASVNRLSLSGRIGGVMAFTESIGIVGRVGHHLGYASGEDNGAKTTWWPSGFDAAWGLTFEFGGE